jgi:hypothetical protein
MQLIVRRSSSIAAFVLVSLAALAVHAEEGWLSMRSGYYKERSTRVIQPMLDGHIEMSEDDAIDFHGLVDSITSASAATGAPVNAGAAIPQFSEERYEAGAGYTHGFGGRYKLGGAFSSSTESDYDSNFIGVRGEASFDEKNTVLALGLGRNFDSISNGAGGVADQHKKMNGGSSSLSLTQLINPRLFATFIYDFMDVHGYQANIYRRVSGSDAPAPERVPDLRLRHALYAELRGFRPLSVTTYVLGYRFYVDDWGIVAHTIEARLVQELVPGLEGRLRYRYYTQNAADFYEDTYSKEQVDNNPYITDDAKLDAYHTHIFGGQLVAALSLFGVEGTWSTLRVDVIVERVLQTNAFGNAWSGQLGLVVPVAW